MRSYRTSKEIGHGGFGVVEEVVDATGRRFARKTFRPAVYIPDTAHDRLRTRFKREVQIQAELGGTEIMPVLDHHLSGTTPWFIMPLAERTYEQQIEQDKATGTVNIDAIADILNGLELLHDLGYVHRDLNPKNALLHDGHWKLSDLGAVLPPSGHTVTLTEGTVIYTEKYCAPEQRNDFHRATSAADIYSFGCMLHDIFGKPPRVPYAKQTADGPVGIIIEKCTEPTPARRPTVKILRGILLDALVDVGGVCTVVDTQAGEWLDRLSNVDDWDEEDFEQFARFFVQLDIEERAAGHESEWVYSLSTPFLTRLPADAISRIVQRNDGISDAIVEKYCEWARSTPFLFHFADTVCDRLTVIFDRGEAAAKAMALTALIELGASHNRWYVMRQMLQRCNSEQLTSELARRFAIEIKTEQMESDFRRCVNVVSWNVSSLCPELRRLCSA